MVMAAGELASVAFESGAHASHRRRRRSVEIGRCAGAAGPESPRVLSHGGSTLESRVGEVEEGRSMVGPSSGALARPWRGAVWAASDAADSCEAFAKQLRNRIQTRRGTAVGLEAGGAEGYIENALNPTRTPAPHLPS